MTEQSVQDGAVEVNESEQDRSMARLADILRENGFSSIQFTDCLQLPTVYFEGDFCEGHRGMQIAIQEGFDVVTLKLEWNYRRGKLYGCIWGLVLRDSSFVSRLYCDCGVTALIGSE